MSPPQEGTKVETKAEAEALVPLFKFQRVLNQDQNGRRITLFGTIRDEPAVFTLERAAFPSDATIVSSFLSTLTDTTNLGANDVYRWYMSNHSPSHTTTTQATISSLQPQPQPQLQAAIPDLKLNLIYPCTDSHIRKYTSQPLRHVIESPTLYNQYIEPYIHRTQRTPKRLDWIYNILDGITEQEDVVYRSPDFGKSTASEPQGFLLLPDLNWDRKMLSSLHLLALVERRDISSLRDLRKSHVSWLWSMLEQIRIAAARRGTELAAAAAAATTSNGAADSGVENESMDPDQVKCYVHYQPTYYHFHIHVVHVMLEPEGGTQSVGKAFGLEMLITMLEGLKGNGEEDPGLNGVDLAYHVGEQSEIWKKCFARVKKGERVNLLDG